MPSGIVHRRALPLLLLLLIASGCTGDRLVGSWEGTYDGETHELKFTGSGRLLRSTDLIGDQSGWTSWRATDERGNTYHVTAGGEKLLIEFKDSNSIKVYKRDAQITIQMKRTDIEKEEQKDTRSYAMAYLLVILAVAFGLVVVCRPSGRAES
ncbi:MAG: hypothetical protein MI757_05430 [Pirellulales bacterium]|nr:hypothetical protein [Pirellulales bacterium]